MTSGGGAKIGGVQWIEKVLRTEVARPLFPLSILIALGVVAVLLACNAAPVPVSTSVGPQGEMSAYLPEAVSGEIVVAGSSTVFPIAERMKQRFEEEGFSGQLTIDSIGSGAGFERFCVAGETDIATASRRIKDSELASCREIGRKPVEFQIGIDALAVVVAAENDFVTGVTLDELGRLFSTAGTWSEVRREWPAEAIQRFSPGTDSGTFDYFVNAVMAPASGGDAAAGEDAILNAVNLQFSEDDNVLVQGVLGSPYAIGYFGFAYYDENRAVLRPLSIDGVTPTEATAESGEYPIARPLFIYSSGGIMRHKPQVAAFIRFFIENVDQEILDVGYFPVSAARMQADLQAWKAAVGR